VAVGGGAELEQEIADSANVKPKIVTIAFIGIRTPC